MIEVEFAGRAVRMEMGREAPAGGARLRALRERQGKTQLWVELEADLGTGYLQRLESGRVAQPERPTLERILTALGARYTERRETLEAFGYVVATPPPDDADLAWARETCRGDLDAVAFPAYLLDCLVRLVAWNRFLPTLLGVAADDPLLDLLTGRSLLAAWFDPTSPLGGMVAEPDAFLPMLIRALRYELRRYRDERWATAMVDQLQAELPLFRRYWDLVAVEAESAGATRARTPIRLIVPGAGALQFQLSSEALAHDSRFRLIYLFPADAPTIRQCRRWVRG